MQADQVLMEARLYQPTEEYMARFREHWIQKSGYLAALCFRPTHLLQTSTRCVCLCPHSFPTCAGKTHAGNLRDDFLVFLRLCKEFPSMLFSHAELFLPPPPIPHHTDANIQHRHANKHACSTHAHARTNTHTIMDSHTHTHTPVSYTHLTLPTRRTV